MIAETMIRHLVDLSLVAVLLLAGFALGSFLLSWIGKPSRPVDQLLIATTIGTGVLGIGLMVVAGFSLVGPLPLWCTVLILGALGWREVSHLPLLLREAGRLVVGEGGVSAFFLVGSLSLVTVVLLVGGLAPPTDWDSLMYHLEIPRQFLEEGRIFVPPDNLHVAFLGIPHFLYLPLISVGGWAGPALLNGAFVLILGLGVLAAGDRLFGRTTGVVSFVALWGTASLVIVGVTSRVDVTVATFLFLAHYSAVALLVFGSRWGLPAAALLAGLAVGVKYHALAYLAPLAPVVLWGAVSTWGRDRKGLRQAVVFAGALGLLAMAPGMVRNQILLGAPLYPFFTDPILPPWLAQLAGTVTHPSSVPTEVYGALSHAREPVTLRGLLFDPASLTVEEEGRGFPTNPVFYLLPLSLLFLRDRAMLALLAPAVGYLLLLLVPFEWTNLRYLIPAVPALTLASVEGVRRSAERFVEAERLRLALLIAGVLSLIPASRGIDQALLQPSQLAVVAGLTPPETFLGLTSGPGFVGYYGATRWLNELTDPSARVVLMFEARGLYFDRTVLQDNILVNWPLLHATPAARACLEGTGITHILVNTITARYYQSRGLSLGLLGMQDFPRFMRSCLEPVHHQDGFELYRVRSLGSDPSPVSAGFPFKPFRDAG